MRELLAERPAWRLAGPFRGGRSVAVAGDPSAARRFYFGACVGGVWRTEDAGLSWQNLTDGQVKSASVGALAVAPSRPTVLYAGMGEACIRGNVVAGDGVWRSGDGGVTWQHRGLPDSRHIARLRVHPHDPDRVFAAVFGHVYGPSEERGVFRSDDGGRHWQRVLYRSAVAGAADLAMDSARPDILFATLWDAHRTPHSLVSGGPDSAVMRSMDGGDTWEDLTARPGLPSGLKGRMGVALSCRPGTLWLLVEAAEGGLFRSDDYGDHWTRVSEDPDLRQRPWYYMHVFAHPTDPETVYVLNLRMWRSRDGGVTFTEVPTPHGDNHDLWIDPASPDRMIEGNDGGAVITFDGGATWSLPYSQPTGQFYHVTTDRAFPYRIYAAQQDNSTLSLPSLSQKGFITAGDTAMVGGGESGYIAVRPDDPDIVYAGSYASRMTRHDHRSGQDVDITVWPEDPIGYGAGDLRYRFQWTFPIVLSPHDPQTLYAAGNVVFRSRSGGDRWEPISPDLTRNDPATLGPSGGPITRDNVSTEYYGTVFAFAESPRKAGVLWAGSDDGLVHVSQDGGTTWRNVTPPDLPEWALVSIIEPSPHDPACAFVAATRYKLEDLRPYLFRTDDYGATWRSVAGNLPEDAITRVVRQDPEVADLLYCGTESAVYVSYDGGATWHRLGGRMPVCSMHDLVVHGTDLIVATHGRGIWVLDDLTPYREAARDPARPALRLFRPRPAYRMQAATRFPGGGDKTFHPYRQAGGEQVVVRRTPHGEEPVNAGENPPPGLTVTYALAKDAEGAVELRVRDRSGALVRRLRSDDATGPGAQLGTVAGLHRFHWDLRAEPGVELPGAKLSLYWGGSTIGPKVPPGAYTVEVEVDGVTASAPAEVRADPRLRASQEDLEAQYKLLLAIRDTLSDVHRAILAGRAVRDQLANLAARLAGGEHAALGRRATELSEAIAAAEAELHESRAKGGADAFNYPPKVNSRLASLESTVAYGDARPPEQCEEVFRLLAERAAAGVAALRRLCGEELRRLAEAVAAAGVGALEVPPAEADGRNRTA
jgi:photosystem II stability/assembly factor-like uncharacterized protein